MRSPRALYFLDALILLSAAAAVLIVVTGGFYSEPFGIRVSVRRLERPLLLALVLGFVRWRWLRSHEFFGWPADVYRRLWSRLYDAGADGPASTTTPWWHHGAVLVSLGAIAAGMLHAQLQQMTSVPDLGDPLFSMWRMGWLSQQLQGDPRALFDANIFHPTPLTLTLSDSMLLPSLFAAPLFAWGVHPLLIYNGLLLASFPLNGFATYGLLKRLGLPTAASFSGALFYMCHPYRLEHYSHFELQMTMWMPMTLWLIVHFGESRRFVYALAAAVCATAQLYSSMYYGAYFPFYLLPVVVVLAVARHWPWKPLLARAAVAGVAAIALAAPLAKPYIAAQTMKGERDTAAVSFYSATATDYVRAHQRLALYGTGWLPDPQPERSLFPGVTPIVLSAVALAPPLGPVRAAFAAGLLVSYDLSRGMNGILYPPLYNGLPPFRGMRVPALISIILGISLAVLSAFGVRRLLARMPSRWRRLAFPAVVGLIIVDLWPAMTLYPVYTEIPRIYQGLAGRSDVVLAEFPFEQRDVMTTDELPFMYFSLWHWREMVNGYSGFTPEGHRMLVALARDFPDAASIAALRTHGVTHVTVNCWFIGDSCREFMDRIDVRPEFKLMRVAHWRGRPTRLYEFVR